MTVYIYIYIYIGAGQPRADAFAAVFNRVVDMHQEKASRMYNTTKTYKEVQTYETCMFYTNKREGRGYMHTGRARVRARTLACGSQWPCVRTCVAALRTRNTYLSRLTIDSQV